MVEAMAQRQPRRMALAVVVERLLLASTAPGQPAVTVALARLLAFLGHR